VPVQSGEQVTQNNARDALIQVNDRAEKVLYYEGEPRWDYKFIRRAVEDDKNLQLVSMDRTAENKYYRQGVTNPDELIGGFPKTREELFGYRAIILGSVEAASFTPEQLRIIADFVNKRGGALLMLGGRRSFAKAAGAARRSAKCCRWSSARRTPSTSPPTSASVRRARATVRRSRRSPRQRRRRRRDGARCRSCRR
jgi:hypothetical protein